METINRRCSGIDVHKDSLEVCVRILDEQGCLHKQTRPFATHTRDLLRLSDWLAAEGVTHVAMESTGVYWKPIFNILESRFTIILVNAQQVKKVPGRKTDVLDCEWLAQLMQHGLLRASFIPPRAIRDLRDLTRHRTQTIDEQARAVNRIQKILEDANIKLGSVVTDIMGVSGCQMLEALLDGQSTAEQMADLAKRRMRSKIPELQLALAGRMTEHHRFMIRLLMDHWTQLEALVVRMDVRIAELMKPYEEEVRRWDEIPGIDQRVAETVVAEVGPTMDPFPTDAHISSWAGVCPGNNESAGKRKSGKLPKGSRWLRRALNQAGWAASHTKDTYLAAKYKRLAPRRGKKRACMALAHTILVIGYHMSKQKTHYKDLGGNYFDQRDSKRLTKYFVKRLEQLGHKVSLDSAA